MLESSLIRMEPAGRYFGRMRLPSGVMTPEDVARAAWAKAVGKKIAVHTEAVGLVRSSLVVEVEDHLWQRNLNTLRSQILANIRKAIGPGVVEDLDFRRRAAPRRAPQRATQAASPAAHASDESAGIQDPVLRRLYIVSRSKAASA